MSACVESPLTGCDRIRAIGGRLTQRSGAEPPAVYDSRIDSAGLAECGDPAALRHAQQQTLMRAYQARYVLLPSAKPDESIVARLHRHYDPREMAALESLRAPLEFALIEPLLAAARESADGLDATTYAAHLVPGLQDAEEAPFIAFLRGCPSREHHYRNFLIQSSADLLAEASASAMGVIGEFGAPQSALFRILIDEFGYGVHERKHSVLFRATMRDFGLCDEYNAYWPLFDTVAIELHNAIHYLFQNPRHFFLQIGFLLFAETAYQRATRDHFHYLREFHNEVDARYFGEHAHIDLHHTRMVVDEVIAPLVRLYGGDAGREIVVGAELTRRVFAATAAHHLAVSVAFEAAVASGAARHAAPDRTTFDPSPSSACITPAAASVSDDRDARIRIGGIGVLTNAAAFAHFPEGSIGRLVTGASR